MTMQSDKIYPVRFWRFFRGLLSVLPGFRQKRHQPLPGSSRKGCYGKWKWFYSDEMYLL